MDLSTSGAAFLRLQEGFVDHYYLDVVHVPTIGIGFTWGSAAFRDWWKRNRPGQAFGPAARMSRAEADACLIEIVGKEYGKAVNDAVGTKVQHVFDAASSTTFNCGPGTLKDKWARALAAGDIGKAADLLKTTRVTAKGKKLAGLVRRRREEALLLRDGIYTGVAKPATPVAPDAMADGILVKGERGPAVAALIRDLSRLGFYSGTLDDLFGFGTQSAVLAFQRANRLKADGFAGPKTLAAIAADLKQAA